MNNIESVALLSSCVPNTKLTENTIIMTNDVTKHAISTGLDIRVYTYETSSF
jgi:hypothetical protein